MLLTETEALGTSLSYTIRHVRHAIGTSEREVRTAAALIEASTSAGVPSSSVMTIFAGAGSSWVFSWDFNAGKSCLSSWMGCRLGFFLAEGDNRYRNYVRGRENEWMR